MCKCEMLVCWETPGCCNNKMPTNDSTESELDMKAVIDRVGTVGGDPAAQMANQGLLGFNVSCIQPGMSVGVTDSNCLGTFRFVLSGVSTMLVAAPDEVLPLLGLRGDEEDGGKDQLAEVVKWLETTELDDIGASDVPSLRLVNLRPWDILYIPMGHICLEMVSSTITCLKASSAVITPPRRMQQTGWGN